MRYIYFKTIRTKHSINHEGIFKFEPGWEHTKFKYISDPLPLDKDDIVNEDWIDSWDVEKVVEYLETKSDEFIIKEITEKEAFLLLI